MSNSVKLCLIERLVYDDIYKHVIGYQDLGHSHELEVVRRIYDTYFPENRMNIHVSYVKNKPYILKIVYNNKHEERYIKSLDQDGTYDNDIDCKRWIDRKLYIKTQSFDSETDWLL